jgi:DNA-binding winged helix-turn-helix (wHTH) protein
VALKLFELRPPSGLPAAYRFGEFRLDVSRRLLSKRGRVIAVPERIFEILLMLIEANGGVVHRDEIALQVWPDTVVADGNIAQHIYLLRKILGEHAGDHRLIAVVNRKGYRLTAPVVAEPHGNRDTQEIAQTFRASESGSLSGWCGPIR